MTVSDASAQRRTRARDDPWTLRDLRCEANTHTGTAIRLTLKQNGVLTGCLIVAVLVAAVQGKDGTLSLMPDGTNCSELLPQTVARAIMPAINRTPPEERMVAKSFSTHAD